MTSKFKCPEKRIKMVRGKGLDDFSKEVYLRWATMMSRCYNPNRAKYKSYGARGIRVCEEWHDVRKFAKWAKENGYAPDLQLDRIDNNGHYCPENCHFVSAIENSQNKQNSKKVTALGKTLCVSEWARRLGISPYTMYYWAKQGSDYIEKRIVEFVLSKKGLL